MFSSLSNLGKGRETPEKCFDLISEIIIEYLDVYGFKHNVKNGTMVCCMIVDEVIPGSTMGLLFQLKGRRLEDELSSENAEPDFLKKIIKGFCINIEDSITNSNIKNGSRRLFQYLTKGDPKDQWFIEY